MSTDANNYDLHNVECQRLLPGCQISSRSPRFAKRTVTNIGYVLRRSFCLQQSAPACGLTDGGITTLSDSQGCDLCNFALILWSRHNRTVIQHSQCMQYAIAVAHAFRAATKHNSLLLRQHIWCLRNFFSFDDLTDHVEMDLMWFWR